MARRWEDEIFKGIKKIGAVGDLSVYGAAVKGMD